MTHSVRPGSAGGFRFHCASGFAAAFAEGFGVPRRYAVPASYAEASEPQRGG